MKRFLAVVLILALVLAGSFIYQLKDPEIRFSKFHVVEFVDDGEGAFIEADDGSQWLVFNKTLKPGKTYVGRWYTWETKDISDDEYLDYIGEDFDELYNMLHGRGNHSRGCFPESNSGDGYATVVYGI